jgi:hypothetical protein
VKAGATDITVAPAFTFTASTHDFLLVLAVSSALAVAASKADAVADGVAVTGFKVAVASAEFSAVASANNVAVVHAPVTSEDAERGRVPSDAEMSAVRPAAVTPDCPAEMTPVVLASQEPAAPTPLRRRAQGHATDEQDGDE